MAGSSTPTISLYKPSTDENFNLVLHFNANWDKIDTAFANLDLGITVINDLAALKAINTVGEDDFKVVVVKTLGMFYLDKSSVLAGDDVNVIVPTAGGGRWITVKGQSSITLGTVQPSLGWYFKVV